MRILVCPPDHFDVEYVINPWMEGQRGCVDLARARDQWKALFEDVSTAADLVTVSPERHSPDMCFTANAGLVGSGRVVPARFRWSERSAEEAPFARWFKEAHFDVAPLPGPDAFEGEGDALFQPGQPLLWAGYGVRTARETHAHLSETFTVEVVSLRLVDQRFYHLDTCFAPLPGGRLIYYPDAFDPPSQTAIAARIPADRRVAVSERDALDFACNALCIEDRIYLNAASDALQKVLASWNFETRLHPVDEFVKAGGGVKCLALLLDQSPCKRTALRSESVRRSRC